MWDEVANTAQAQMLMETREKELVDKHWSNLVGAGARVLRFTGNALSAWSIVATVIENHDSSEAIQLQQELVDLRRRLSETEAAKALYSSLMRGMEEHKRLLVRLEKYAHSKKDAKEEARLRSQIEEVNKQIDHSFKALDELKIPLGRRIALWFRRIF
jgi:hypothetical protein